MTKSDKAGTENSTIRICPGCGGKNLVWPSVRDFYCSDCGFTLYLNMAAAVAVIIECNGKILFGVRKNEPGRGMLDLPGGFVDPGESAEDAGRREVLEETGLHLDTLSYLFSFPNLYPYKGIVYNTLDLIFLVRCERQPTVVAGDDLAELLWVERTQVDLAALAFDSLRNAVRRYLAAA